MRKVIVEAYTSDWETEFKKAQSFYSEILKGLNIRIEHVGSTAVKGLSAKPILDIDIIVSDIKTSNRVIEVLESVGYIHEGDLGIIGREAMKYHDDNKYITWMKHHLYVCLEGTENLNNHLLLRDYLRGNEEAVKGYSELKVELAKKYPFDINSYINGKTEFIIDIVNKAKVEKSDRDQN